MLSAPHLVDRQVANGCVTPTPASAIKPLVDVLHATAREATSLGQLACDLQAALSPLERTAGHAQQKVEDLQSLDLLVQRLYGLADFLNALVPSLPIEWTSDVSKAAQVVTLSDMAQRLSCLDSTQNYVDVKEAGLLELFEDVLE